MPSILICLLYDHAYYMIMPVELLSLSLCLLHDYACYVIMNIIMYMTMRIVLLCVLCNAYYMIMPVV